MAEDEYDVGYKKPPKKSQFAKGKSGNPRGRPKGSKNVASIFHEVTRELIHISENGKVRTVTKIEAIYRQLTSKAMSGDIRAAREILQWNRVFEATADEGLVENPDFQKNGAVLRKFIDLIRDEEQSLTEEESNEEPPDDDTSA